MSSSETDSISSQTRWWRRSGVVALATSLALLVGLAVLSGLTVRDVRTSIDTVTGSVKRNSAWRFLDARSAGTASSEVSALERRLVERGIEWNTHYQHFGTTYFNIWGRPIGYGCTVAPAIYGARWLDEEALRSWSDEELRALVDVMQAGTESQQKAAIEALFPKAHDNR